MRFHYSICGSQYVVWISGFAVLFFTDIMGDGLYVVDDAGNKAELLQPFVFSVSHLPEKTAKRTLRKHLMSFINRGVDIYEKE